MENWDMIMVEKYPCNDKLELLKKEREVFETLKATLNSEIPSRTQKEYKLDNKETIKEKKKQYHLDNKETINQQRKEKSVVEYVNVWLENMISKDIQELKNISTILQIKLLLIIVYINC
jgi:hypothetical protein